MKVLLLIIFTLFSFVIEAQSLKSTCVSFIPMFNNQLIVLDTTLSQDNQTITKLKFYVSNITFWDGDELVWEEKDSYHLLDMEDIKSMNLILNLPEHTKANRIAFDLGVDSLANVSGAMAGDLDPMHGMYWAWQSGYINFKLEGKSDLCPARKNKYQFHLGGFQSPFVSLQQISLLLTNLGDIKVSIDIGKLFEDIDVSKTYEIMSPKAEAVTMSQNLASYFEILE